VKKLFEKILCEISNIMEVE